MSKVASRRTARHNKRMISINVELAGPMRRPWPEPKRDVELPDGATVAELLASLGFKSHESRFLSVAVNGTKVKHTSSLDDKDQVFVLLIVGGG